MEKWILCKHKGYVLNVIVEKTSNKYKFYNGRPLLIKDKTDIEYFLNHDNYVESESPKVMTDKLTEIEAEVVEEAEAEVLKVVDAPVKPKKNSKKKSKKGAK